MSSVKPENEGNNMEKDFSAVNNEIDDDKGVN